MNLSNATVLLGDQGRFFSEVYKHFQYLDEQLLKDYLDFVIHEPKEWLKGFPSKLTKPGTFAKPKTALIKLLKHPDVKAVLDEAYLTKVHDIVWQTFKSQADTILHARQHNEPIVANTIEYATEECEGESIHTIVPNASDWERKYRVLESVVRDLVQASKDTHPGLVAATLTLLSSLSSS